MSVDRPTILYRVYGDADELLYVGITFNPGVRLKEHQGCQPWWLDAQRIELEQFATRREAVAAEHKAVKSENPTHNYVGTERQRERGRLNGLRQHGLA